MKAICARIAGKKDRKSFILLSGAQRPARQEGAQTRESFFGAGFIQNAKVSDIFHRSRVCAYCARSQTNPFDTCSSFVCIRYQSQGKDQNVPIAPYPAPCKPALSVTSSKVPSHFW